MRILRIVLVSILLVESGSAYQGSARSPLFHQSHSIFETEAMTQPLDWAGSSALDQKSRWRTRQEAKKRYPEKPFGAVSLYRVHEETSEKDFPILIDREVNQLVDTVAGYVHGLPTVYSASSLVNELQHKLAHHLKLPANQILVEVAHFYSQVPAVDKGFLSSFYFLPKENLFYLKMQHELLSIFEFEPRLIDSFVIFTARYWEEKQMGLLDQEANELALKESSKMPGLLDRVLKMIWEYRVSSPAINQFTNESYLYGGALERKDHPLGKGDVTYISYGNIKPGTPEFKIEQTEGPGKLALLTDKIIESSESHAYVAQTVRDEYQDILQREIFYNPAAKRTITAEQVFGFASTLRRRLFKESIYNVETRLDFLLRGGPKLYGLISLLRLFAKKKFKTLVRLAVLMDYANNIYEQALDEPPIEVNREILDTWLKQSQPGFQDDSDLFDAQLRNPTTYVHVVGSVNSLAPDLVVFGQALLKRWGNEGQVVFLVKEKRVGSDATEEDIKNLLKHPQFASLQSNPRFKIVALNLEGPGTDFRKIADSAASWLKKVQEGNAILGIRGENNYFTSNGILLNHFRLTTARRRETQRTFGTMWDGDAGNSCPPIVVVYVPAGISPLRKSDTIPAFIKTRRLVEQSLSIEEIKKLYDWTQLLMDRDYLSFVEAVAPEQLFETLPLPIDIMTRLYATVPQIRDRFRDLREYILHYRQYHLNAIAAGRFGPDTYSATAYALEGTGNEPKPGRFQEDPFEVENWPKTYVTGVLLDPAKWALDYVIASEANIPGKNPPHPTIPPDDVFKIFPFDLVMNADYDATEIVMESNNNALIAHGHKREVIRKKNFHIDASQFLNREGIWEETPPLYNKAFVGMNADGKLVFGWRRMLGGSMSISNPRYVLRWKKRDLIDEPRKLATLNERDLAVITPMVSRNVFHDDPEFKRLSNHRSNEVLPVGKDRINIIIIDNEITAIVKGTILMPSLGYVISLKPQVYEPLFADWGLINRYKELPKAKFQYDWDKDPDKPARPDLWYAGGLAMLVYNGKNLVSTEQTQEMNWGKEGWYKSLSSLTQGTSVQLRKRDAMGVFGLTWSEIPYYIPLAGRVPGHYAGVNVSEAVLIVEHWLAKFGEKARYAINFDGGSSVQLSMRGSDDKAEALNPIAGGSTNVPGKRRNLARYIGAYLKENFPNRISMTSNKARPRHSRQIKTAA